VVFALMGSAIALLHYFQLPPLGAYVVPILTGISGFLIAFRTWARTALKFIQAAQDSKQQLVEKKKRERTQELEKEYNAIRTQVNEARTSVESATKTVERLNEQLENMHADRKMADYIRQRHESSDYTKHLGIIAKVRADFRHLSILLREAREESERDVEESEREKEMKKRQEEKDIERREKGGKPLFPRIDRIILYIDDLDRCPERNVFEVLQAVHLLLAFPLFVVVVGVDPRWLLHSLEQQAAVFKADRKNPDIQNEAQTTEDDFIGSRRQ